MLITDNEKRVSDQIYYGIPDVLNRDKDRYKNKTVAVVGSGHSAINTLLDLTQLKAFNWVKSNNVFIAE